jgi:hypothetical protein
MYGLTASDYFIATITYFSRYPNPCTLLDSHLLVPEQRFSPAYISIGFNHGQQASYDRSSAPSAIGRVPSTVVELSMRMYEAYPICTLSAASHVEKFTL